MFLVFIGYFAIRPWQAGIQTQDDDGPGPGANLPSGEIEPLRAVAGKEQMDLLQQGVAALPQGQRQVFELGVLQELGYSEIGELLQIPVGTVKSRMFHAVRRLRDFLGTDSTGEES